MYPTAAKTIVYCCLAVAALAGCSKSARVESDLPAKEKARAVVEAFLAETRDGAHSLKEVSTKVIPFTDPRRYEYLRSFVSARWFREHDAAPATYSVNTSPCDSFSILDYGDNYVVAEIRGPSGTTWKDRLRFEIEHEGGKAWIVPIQITDNKWINPCTVTRIAE